MAIAGYLIPDAVLLVNSYHYHRLVSTDQT